MKLPIRVSGVSRGTGAIALRVLWVRTQPADSELKTNQADRRAWRITASHKAHWGLQDRRDPSLNKELPLSFSPISLVPVTNPTLSKFISGAPGCS